MIVNQNLSMILARLLLSVGFAMLVAATPAMLPDANTDCKKAGQITTIGEIVCDSGIKCGETGVLCQKTKWAATVGANWTYFCSCTANDTYSGADPTSGICMAWSTSAGSGGQQVGHCSSGGCADNEVCDKDTGFYKKCVCQKKP